MPAAVLAKIGRRALITVNRGRTIIIGEGAGQQPRPVIVKVADFVRRPVVRANMVHASVVDANMVDPEFGGQARRYGQRGQEGGGGKELYAGHLGPPKDARKEDILGQVRFPSRAETPG
jgi:hypothetical protein